METELNPEELSRLAAKMTVSAVNRKGKLSRHDVMDMVRAFSNTDETLASLARRFRVSTNTVRYHLTRYVRRHGGAILLVNRQREQEDRILGERPERTR